MIKQISPTVFHIKDVDVSVVNAIRRIILAEIPNLAFDPAHINISKNTCPINNELLMQRLSFIPVHFNPSDIQIISTWTFKISKKNTTDSVVHVTSKDIQVFDQNNNRVSESIESTLFPPDKVSGDHILITLLMPNLQNTRNGQELELVMQPTKGIAKENARWCPVSKCSFMNVLDEDLVCLEKSNAIDKGTFETHTKYRYYKKDAFGEPNEFDMFIESECAMTSRYLVQKAFKILIDKINTFLNKTTVHIQQNMLSLTILDEDYTLLNVLQSLIYNIELRDNKSQNIDYVGHFQPHPLETKMILKMHYTQSNNNIKFHNDFFPSLIYRVSEYVSNIASSLS